MAMPILGNLIAGQFLSVLLVGAVNSNADPARELHAVVLGWTQLFQPQFLNCGLDIVDVPFSRSVLEQGAVNSAVGFVDGQLAIRALQLATLVHRSGILRAA